MSEINHASWFDSKPETKINGRLVKRGTELTVKGHGRMRFIAHVLNTKSGAEWIECVDKDRRFRAFRIDEIKRVHYKDKLRH